jgi:hypothetical protein
MTATKPQQEVKARPIIFSAEMVKAILEGRKTQTRRIIKPQPAMVDDLSIPNVAYAGGEMVKWFGKQAPNTYQKIHCPYGEVGDKLWCRETFTQYRANTPEEMAITNQAWDDFRTGKKDLISAAHSIPAATGERQVLYAADFGDWAKNVDCDIKWTSPIFMPRWASRITLEIVGVRVERVKGISPLDAIAEGIERLDADTPFRADFANQWRDYSGQEYYFNSPIDSFHSGWNKINGKKAGCDWASNPWVWVLEFRRVD